MKKIFFYCIIILFSACNLKEQDKKTAKSYFDLDNYFKLEAIRLTEANLDINKTVLVNGQTEEKKVKIINWEKEFESFIVADINKSSWRGSFEQKKDNNTESYLTKNDKIPIKKVVIYFRKAKIYGIKIFITNNNRLYKSTDSLSYYPDSLYQIKKVQEIKLMGKKIYQITGKF